MPELTETRQKIAQYIPVNGLNASYTTPNKGREISVSVVCLAQMEDGSLQGLRVHEREIVLCEEVAGFVGYK